MKEINIDSKNEKLVFSNKKEMTIAFNMLPIIEFIYKLHKTKKKID